MSKDIRLLVIVIVVLAVLAVGLWYWKVQHNTASPENTTVTKTINEARNINTSPNTDNDEFQVQDQAKKTLVSNGKQAILEFSQVVTNTTEGDITTYHFSAENIVNEMPATYQSLVLNETPIQKRTKVTVGDLEGERLTLSSAKDGSDIDVIQIIFGTTLYDIRGTTDFLDKIESFMRFKVTNNKLILD